MEFKGASGEWFYSPQDGEPGHCLVPQIWTSSEDNYIASIRPTDDPKVATANAKLMAAAPELLHALQNAHSYLQSFQPQWMEGEEILVSEIETALNKALK
jgi:hypothetical protein